MELPRLSVSGAPIDPPTLPSPHGSYAHLPLATNPKGALIRASLRRLKLLPSDELINELLSALNFGNDDVRSAAIAKYEENEHEILKALETETHIALIESVDERFQGFVLQHCADLIKEYVCTTPSEKMLCGLAAGAMARHLSFARKLKDLTDEYAWTTTDMVIRRPTMKYTGEYEETRLNAGNHTRRVMAVTKEVDRSLRQYQTIIGQLAQMKSPVPDVHIQTAFLAQNQQINATRTP